MDPIFRRLLDSDAPVTIPIAPAIPREPPPAPADSILSEDSRRLFTAWQSWRGDRPLPRRADLDLVSISRLMPRLAVLDVRAPDDIVFRLAGTEIEEQFGQRLTGHSYVTMVPPEQQPRRGELLWRVATQPCACLQHAIYTWKSGQHSVLEFFGVPMQPDRDGEPMQYLAVVSHLPPSVWGRSDAVTGMKSRTIQPIDIGAGVPAL